MPVTNNFTYYLVLKSGRKADKAMAVDLSLEIFEDQNIATQVLMKFFISRQLLLNSTSHVSHPDFPGSQSAVSELVSFATNKTHQQIVELIRFWLTLPNPEKHIALLGFAYTGIKKALAPKRLFLCPVSNEYSISDSPEFLSKVVISDGWVKELENGDSCPIPGCIPVGENYVCWKLYPEDTFVPVLGTIDFVRNNKSLNIVKEWCHKNPNNPISKVLYAIIDIEEIEIIRGALFV